MRGANAATICCAPAATVEPLSGDAEAERLCRQILTTHPVQFWAPLIATIDSLRNRIAELERENERLHGSMVVEKKWRKDSDDRAETAEERIRTLEQRLTDAEKERYILREKVR